MTHTHKNSAHLVFDGRAHQIQLVGSDGEVKGHWPAFNNVDSHATIRALANKRYTVEDKLKPHAHKADANGPYGSHGIIRFNVSGHPGIGVHSGRASAKHLPGPAHPTMGCIRTSDEAMAKIVTYMRSEPISSVEVKNNSVPVAKHSSQRHKTSAHVTHVQHSKH